MSILEFLGLRPGSGDEAPGGSSAASETVRKIVEKLDRLEPERARYIAAFAYVLGRVAHADLDISREETRTMERIVMDFGRLPEAEALIVVQMAKTQNLLFGSTENFLVTREFNEIACREDKLRLLECLFAVSAADASVSTIEENEIRRVVSELRLGHQDYIEARLAYREHLAVLRSRDLED